MKALVSLTAILLLLVAAAALGSTQENDNLQAQTITSVNGSFTLRLWNVTTTTGGVTMTSVCGDFSLDGQLLTHCGLAPIPEFPSGPLFVLLATAAMLFTAIAVRHLRRTSRPETCESR